MPETAALSAVTLNHKCVSRAESLIHAGNVVDSSAWEAPTDPSPEDCLGIHTDETEGTKARYGYPIIKGGRLNRKGVIAAESRASQQGETAIVSAAKHILEMIDAKKPAATSEKTASLRAPTVYSAPGEIQVDEQKGLIANVALMTVGPARGHGFDIDMTTLEQLKELINSDPSGIGIKCRLTHPGVDGDGNLADDLLQLVGRACNARIVGNVLRGDVQLGDFAKKVPGLGDVWSYLCSLAKNDPTALGMSAMFTYSIDPQMESGAVTSLPARIASAVGVDFVGKPAANPNGLLSVPAKETRRPVTVLAALHQTNKESKMDTELKALLISMGMPQNATDEDACEYLSKLPADQRGQLAIKYGKTLPEAKAATAVKADDPTVVALANRDRAATDLGEQTVGLEMRRKTQIVALAAALSVGDMKIDNTTIVECVSKKMTVEQARDHMLAALALHLATKKREAIDPEKDERYMTGGEPGNPDVQVGNDNNLASLREDAGDALALRMIDKCYDRFNEPAKHKKMTEAITKRDNQRIKQMASLKYGEFCRRYLASLGMKNANNLNDAKLAECTTVRGLRASHGRVAALAESVGDLSNITLDAFNKTLRVAYFDAPRTWPIWARRATAPDFKNINRVVLSEAPNMVARNQGGELKYVTLTDSKETYALATYSQLIRATWRLLINDDMNSLSRVPMLQANAAMRQEEDTAYAIITANAALADAGLLFNSTAIATAGGHLNLAGSGTSLSVSSIQTGWTAIKKQKGLAAAARLELVPKFLLVPTSIEFTAQQLIGSESLIPGIAGGGSSGTPVAGTVNQGQKNPFFNKLTVVGSTRLDDNSATAWYLFSDYRDAQIDTIEVCFLEDEPEPVAKAETDFDTDDLKFALRHTVAAKAIDFRGLYKNPGA